VRPGGRGWRSAERGADEPDVHGGAAAGAGSAGPRLRPVRPPGRLVRVSPPGALDRRRRDVGGKTGRWSAAAAITGCTKAATGWRASRTGPGPRSATHCHPDL